LSQEERTIYLDNAATTALDPEVLDSMLPFLQGGFANPSSAHSMGQAARRALDEAREKAAAIVGTKPSRLIFTSGGSESNNMIIRGLSPRLREKRLIMTRLEHPSVQQPVAFLNGKGYATALVSNDSSGRVNLGRLEELLLEEKCGLLCVIHGSNEVGTVQDAEAIGRLLRSGSPETWFHLDAVQSAGYLPLEAEKWGVDSITISAHKFHGPKGSGLLALFRDAPIEPLITGGGQEGGYRSGTENVAAVVGGVEAFARAADNRSDRSTLTAMLRDGLRDAVARSVPDALFNGAEGSSLPHILSVSFSGLLAEVLLHHMEKEGIMVSAGSACHSGRAGVSPTIEALGLPSGPAQGTIRMSLSHRNTIQEVERAARVVAEQVSYLREIGIQ